MTNLGPASARAAGALGCETGATAQAVGAGAALRPDEQIRVRAAKGVELGVFSYRSRARSSVGRILLVPGFLSFVESWELVIAQLVRRFDVYYFESREKRSSLVPRNGRFRIQELVADLGAVVQQLGLSRGTYDVVASCGGAATVLRAHADLGLRPRRLVLVAPVLRPVLPWIVVPLSLVLRGPLYALLQRLAIIWYRRHLGPRRQDAFQHSRFLDVVARADPFKATRAARDLYGLTVDPELARDVDLPVLILAMSGDGEHPFAECQRLARLLPNIRLEDVGLFWRTRSPAAGRAIVRFLEGDERARA